MCYSSLNVSGYCCLGPQYIINRRKCQEHTDTPRTGIDPISYNFKTPLSLILLVRLRGFSLVIRETQRTYEIRASQDSSCSVHSSNESQRVRARFIGREEREVFVLHP